MYRKNLTQYLNDACTTMDNFSGMRPDDYTCISNQSVHVHAACKFGSRKSGLAGNGGAIPLATAIHQLTRSFERHEDFPVD